MIIRQNFLCQGQQSDIVSEYNRINNEISKRLKRVDNGQNDNDKRSERSPEKNVQRNNKRVKNMEKMKIEENVEESDEEEYLKKVANFQRNRF